MRMKSLFNFAGLLCGLLVVWLNAAVAAAERSADSVNTAQWIARSSGVPKGLCVLVGDRGAELAIALVVPQLIGLARTVITDPWNRTATLVLV